MTQSRQPLHIRSFAFPPQLCLIALGGIFPTPCFLLQKWWYTHKNKVTAIHEVDYPRPVARWYWQLACAIGDLRDHTHISRIQAVRSGLSRHSRSCHG